ncbi:MAG: hypothetical protein ABEJ35_01050 [Halobacteriaceae archaeon]
MPEDSGPDETVNVWLVAREVDDRDLVTLTYATADGRHVDVRQLARSHLERDPATAGDEVSRADLEPVTDPSRQTRFAEEASRVKRKHDPEDRI